MSREAEAGTFIGRYVGNKIHEDPVVQHAAALVVCEHATDVDDARNLLEILGLGPTGAMPAR